MDDQVRSASRPAAAESPAGGVPVGVRRGVPSYTKGQLYDDKNQRRVYRPEPSKRRSKKRRCCLCFMWTCVAVFVLLILLVVAGAIVWAIYRPQRPTFSVQSFEISILNITGAVGGPLLNSQISFSLDAQNPNKKVEFLYDDISYWLESEGVSLGSGSIEGFHQPTKNTTTLFASVLQKNQPVNSAGASLLAADVKKNILPLAVRFQTTVKAKLGALKSWKFGVRVACDGFSAALGKTKGSASNGKCVIQVKVLKSKF